MSEGARFARLQGRMVKAAGIDGNAIPLENPAVCLWIELREKP